MHMRVLAASRPQRGGAGFTQPEMGGGAAMTGMPTRQGPVDIEEGKRILPGAPPLTSAAAKGGATGTIAGVLSRQTNFVKLPTTCHAPPVSSTLVW